MTKETAVIPSAYAEGGVDRQIQGIARRGVGDDLERGPVRAHRRVPGLLAYALVRRGDTERARETLRAAEGSTADPFSLAMAWTAIGEFDTAFRCLEKADWDTINVDMLVLSPALRRLRDDPRYRSLVAELGL